MVGKIIQNDGRTNTPNMCFDYMAYGDTPPIKDRSLSKVTHKPESKTRRKMTKKSCIKNRKRS